MVKRIQLKLLLSIIVCVICVCTFNAFIKVKGYNNIVTHLNGRVIFVDCGHGGKDDGASVGGVVEDSINMKIGGYLLEYLVSLGANVYLSRTGDYDLSSMYVKNKKREDLKNRVDYINKSQPDLFVSIHLNTYSSENVKGGQTFYQNNEKSKLLAEKIQKELNTLTGENKKQKIGDYFLLNKTVPAGVLIECGFLSNNDERLKLNTVVYQRKIALSIKKGIINFFANNN